MAIPSGQSDMEGKRSFLFPSPSQIFRKQAKGDQINNTEPSKKAATDLSNGEGKKAARSSILGTWTALKLWSSGASSQQHPAGRERFKQSCGAPGTGGQDVNVSENSHTMTDRRPKARQRNTTAKIADAKALHQKVCALTLEKIQLKKDLEVQHSRVDQLESELEKQASQARQAETRSKQDGANILTLKRQLQQSRDHGESLLRNLEICKDRIFRMLPVEGMADTQLQQQYITLCKGIESCCDVHFGDAEGFIAALSCDDGSSGRIIGTQLGMDYLSESDLVLAEQNPNIEIPMMQRQIFNYLHETLLGAERIFPGLDPDTETCLGRIIDGLSALKPAKDKEAICMWRIDLQRSLNTDKQLKQLREARLNQIEEHLTEGAAVLKEMGQHGCSSEPSLCRQIVQEAGDLAENIRHSMSQFDFEFELDHPVIKAEQVKDFTIIDSRTGSILSSSAIPVVGSAGRVGEFQVLVYPAFVRRSTESRKKIVLVKPTIVVEFDQPVRRGKKDKSSR
ncbi:hypothetical protein Z517_04084 [Fonsecaea pedrosoi CBS 271.37]|uniref:Uncharacterized protein n=1 Tax=Fonsecaea pedrosoi CBS 271.37 TaxID=1442368 RepID=A0A0D2DTG8_9EURO|nr:uncharacterized protein Z517_04084 [Fonsecaea pedrosoi CBS 271.37]KIW81061.1 hypothetical protein Z517_04084 [Fonsecaea pedrosoi CBS 271.37]